jgi:hypothetical protein
MGSAQSTPPDISQQAGTGRLKVAAAAAVAFLISGGIAVAAVSGSDGPSALRTEKLTRAVADAYAADGRPADDVSCAQGGDTSWACWLKVGGTEVRFRAQLYADGRWRTDSFTDPARDPASEFMSGRSLVGCCIDASPAP